MTKSRREAFTLVELLVVITIIGMLMAIVLPAVSAVKEHARQVTCINNQTEIAKAMLSFETSKSRLPGYCEKYKPASNRPEDESVYAWTIAILPYLQRNDLYTAFISNDRDDRKEAEGNYQKMYVCPSGQKDTSYDALSYVVNSGRGDGSGNQGKDRDIAANGVFHNRGGGVKNPIIVSTSTITRADGVGNTLMLSENLNLGENEKWGWIEYGKDKNIGEGNVSFLWVSDDQPKPKDRINGINNRGAKVGAPSSNHTGGVIATFCNTTAQFIADDIDYKVHWQLMTPDGRNATTRSGDRVEINNRELTRYLLKEQDY